MEYEPVVCIVTKLGWHDFEQLVFYLSNGLARCQACSVRHAEDVGIHRDGGMSECRIEHHVGCLATDTGQGFESCPVFRYLPCVFAQQDVAGF